MAKSLALHTTWKGLDGSGSIETGADARLFFTASNASWCSGRPFHATSFFSKDDKGWIKTA
ncbi:hypothetical protein PF001_g23291 [Phytophthora fragariae]|uniref:Uncharacterized protein n=1 Tax=Phytophthora fragariae TaxID=53985 RepID=A0A6A3ER50_9STRA|nr:hypothetical protein PF003_g28162 [Phytophthora fragariae]KAE8932508.1 hypothetical protein PF009_g17464 [Phytophthora fragariae]KAE9282477.1 hypothetical protein PF001_g23291 [Phytophthora fragariae]